MKRKSRFKKGNLVICKSGFTNNPTDVNYGGSGYEEGNKFLVYKIILSLQNNNKHVLWDGSEERGGIYEFACEVDTEDPLEKVIKSIRKEIKANV